MSIKMAVLFTLVCAAPLSAQEFTPEQEQFYGRYKNLMDIADFSGINNMVARSFQEAEGVYAALCMLYITNGNVETIAEIEPLARAMDTAKSATQFTKRLDYLQTLDSAKHNKRIEGLQLLRTALDVFQSANAKKERPEWQRAVTAIEEALRELVEVGDNEWAAYGRYHLGIAHENLGEYRKVVLDFDKAMTEWLAGGRPKNEQYGYMADKRNDLIEKGYDPWADPGDPSSGDAAKVSTGSSYAEGSEWVETTTQYKEMRKFTDFTTPNPYATTNLFLWRWFVYLDGVHETGINKVRPFGKDIRIVRDGSKGYLDTDEDGESDQPAKILDGKPTPAVIKGGEGRDAPEYSMYLLTIGQGQQYLGFQVNFNNRGIYRSACYREGEVLGLPFVLLDDNCSGSFGDPQETTQWILRGNPGWWDLDAMILGKGKVAVPFSEFVKVGDKWHRLKVLDTLGSSLRTRELDIDTGFVQLDWEGPKQPLSVVIAEVRDFQGAFFDVVGKKPVEVPAGRYEIAIGKIETGKGNNTDQAWILKGRTKPFEVKAGETFVMEMGAPYEFDFLTEDKGREFIVKGNSLLVYDRFGALVGKIYDEVPMPQVSVRTEAGSTLVRGKKTRTVTVDEFNNNQDLAWFPADYVVEKPANAKCQAQLFMKKHKLLGGPFESPWK